MVVRPNGTSSYHEMNGLFGNRQQHPPPSRLVIHLQPYLEKSVLLHDLTHPNSLSHHITFRLAKKGLQVCAPSLPMDWAVTVMPHGKIQVCILEHEIVVVPGRHIMHDWLRRLRGWTGVKVIDDDLLPIGVTTPWTHQSSNHDHEDSAKSSFTTIDDHEHDPNPHFEQGIPPQIIEESVHASHNGPRSSSRPMSD